MKIVKRLISTILVFSIFSQTVLPGVAYAQNDVVEITFGYADEEAGKDRTENCYYSDSFFSQPATVYNPSLATASISFAMASFGTNEAGTDYEQQPKNGLKFLRDAGFSAVKANEDYLKRAELDSIGLVIGYKMLNGTPLIALGVRGGNYTTEWGGNFKIDASGDHGGFSVAADKAIAFVKQYIENDSTLKNYTGDIKLWVTGFSRAAATSNLFAAKLMKTAATKPLGNSITLSSAGLYAYTFATPAGGILTNRNDGVDYSSIFNIMTPHDAVPMVAPSASCFGNFGQYGKNLYLPTNETHADYTNLRAKMLPRHHDRSKYSLDDFKSYKFQFAFPPVTQDTEGISSQGIYFDGFINVLAKNVITSRDYFYSNDADNGYQGSIRKVIEYLMGEQGLTKAQVITLLKKCASLIYQNPKMLWNLFWQTVTNGSTGMKKQLVLIIDKAAKELKYDFSAQKVVDTAAGLTHLLFWLILYGPSYVVTLVIDSMGRSGVLQAHSPALVKAWLETMDPLYTSSPLDPNDVFLSGEYRAVRVSGYNLKMTATGLDGAGSMEASYTDGESSPSSGANVHKQLALFLPPNGSYSITITSTYAHEQSVTYSVSEYNPTVEADAKHDRIKRVISWQNVLLPANGGLTGDVPAFAAEDARVGLPNGSDIAYTLNGSNIPAPVDRKRADLNSNYVNVDLTVVNGVSSGVGDAVFGQTLTTPAYGIAWGAGSKLKNVDATLHAMPLEHGRFVGWYLGNTLKSTELDHTFPVTGAVTYTAKFGFNSIPENVSAQEVTTTLGSPQVCVSWERPAYDVANQDITGYKVYRDGTWLADVTASSDTYSYTYTDSGALTTGATYAYTVTAISAAGESNESEHSEAARVTIGAPYITTDTLPNGIAGASYSTTLTAVGAGSTVWSVAQSSLPPGLILTSGGTISGTPSVADAYVFSVCAANQYGSCTKELTLVVANAAGAPVITTTEIPNAIKSATYSQTLHATGNAPISWSLAGGALPDGLTLDYGTGVISGTPTTSGLYSFTARAYNGVGNDTHTYQLVVSSLFGAPVILTQSLPQPSLGKAYSVTLEAEGLDPIYWGLWGGELPSGLTLDCESGVISGTPTTAGTYTFTIMADNMIGCDERTFTLKLGKNTPKNDPIVISPIYTDFLTRAGYGTVQGANGKVALSGAGLSKGGELEVVDAPVGGEAVYTLTAEGLLGKSVLLGSYKITFNGGALPSGATLTFNVGSEHAKKMLTLSVGDPKQLYTALVSPDGTVSFGPLK